MKIVPYDKIPEIKRRLFIFLVLTTVILEFYLISKFNRGLILCFISAQYFEIQILAEKRRIQSSDMWNCLCQLTVDGKYCETEVDTAYQTIILNLALNPNSRISHIFSMYNFRRKRNLDVSKNISSYSLSFR
ncbi:hypothetical protein RF11_01017 [Thelohanellus kitauei]|uniref:Uncharacterized protein n=1 Tax=Thelohanellus kitauei TaxID=669202 RepID=A0A0C2MUA0_THEKT|nr:hypothetical protein RF11_01017 [Thelohanellus kitauei]